MPSLKKNINQFRRNITRSLTKNTGNEDVLIQGIPPQKIKKVLIVRPNHRLGNMLLVTPIVQEVHQQFPDAKITLFCKGGAAYPIFQEYKSVEKIISLPKKAFKECFKYLSVWTQLISGSYDLVINVIPRSSSGKIATKRASAAFKYFGHLDQEDPILYPDCQQQACHVVYGFREYLKKSGIQPKDAPLPLMDIKLRNDELEKGRKLLTSLTQNQKKNIAIFTYATGDKCFSKEFWMPFYQSLVKEFPQYNIVEVLPAENVSQIDFSAPSFYSKDLREIGAFIAGCELFIGADSGMMHLASASLTPTLGLFSVTDIESFKPYGNLSQPISVHGNEYQCCMEKIKEIIYKLNQTLNPSIQL